MLILYFYSHFDLGEVKRSWLRIPNFYHNILLQDYKSRATCPQSFSVHTNCTYGRMCRWMDNHMTIKNFQLDGFTKFLRYGALLVRAFGMCRSFTKIWEFGGSKPKQNSMFGVPVVSVINTVKYPFLGVELTLSDSQANKLWLAELWTAIPDLRGWRLLF